MNYHNITTDNMLNGDGLRTVLWLAGCEHHCPGCHNPITWDINGGLPFDQQAKEELFLKLNKPYISGLTLSGGDPLHKKNRPEVGLLIDEVRERFPDKTIWVYTGYLWEEIEDLDFMKKVNVVVDGKFVERLKNERLHWKGSVNQRIIDVQQTFKIGKIVLHEGEEYEKDRQIS